MIGLRDNPVRHYQFIHVDEPDQIVMTVSGGPAWPDLADKFLDFLLACGYVVGRQDLADHFDMSIFEANSRKESTNGDGDAD